MKDLIIKWNNLFPFDRYFRKKYNIAFGSPEHRALNQIDMYIDIMEDKFFNKYFKEIEEKQKDRKDYEKTGNFLKDRKEDDQFVSDLFDDLDIEKLDL